MTMRLDDLQAMFEQSTNPNIQVANDMRALAEIGFFNTEITVYGTVFYENGMLKYMVSEHLEKIEEFIQNPINFQLFPTPLSEYSIYASIPEELLPGVKYSVKKELAKQMHQQYPIGYFREVESFMDNISTDLAEYLIQQWRDEIEGRFDSTKIQLFNDLLEQGHMKKIISESFYNDCCKWSKCLLRDIEDEKKTRKRFKKIFYGFSYQLTNGAWAYYINARKDAVHKHREVYLNEGKVVSPIIGKEYYFSRDISPIKIREMFQDDIKELLNDSYLNLWKHICDYKVNVTQNKCTVGAHIRALYGELAEKAFEIVCHKANV